MTAQSAAGPTTTPTRTRQGLAWAQTWLLPPVLGAAVVLAYLLVIVPTTDQPWYMPPTPKPGKSVIFRSLGKVHQVSDEATTKAERKARIDERRKAAADRASKAKDAPAGSDPPGSTDTKIPATDTTTKIETSDPTKAATPPSGPTPEPTLDPTMPGTTLTGQPSATPRTRAELDALWAEKSDAPLDDEPVDESWAQVHKSLHHQLFALTRDAAFDRAPDTPAVSLRDASCRTIRCELVLVSPYHHELTIVADALAELRLKKAPLWRSFVRNSMQTLPAPSGTGEIYELRLVVAFAVDLPDTAEIRIGRRKLIPTNQMSPTGATHG